MPHSPDGSSFTAELSLADEGATLELGAALAAYLGRGHVIHLCGDLGAGKTTLVRGLLRAFGFAGNVKSPTYTLVELYALSKLDLYHFDFYRFTSPEEYLDAGLDEYFHGQGLCLVEWPERAAPYLPPADLRITLALAQRGRRAALAAQSEEGERCLRNLAPRLVRFTRDSC